MTRTLLGSLIRLAHERPDLRPHLLPAIHMATGQPASEEGEEAAKPAKRKGPPPRWEEFMAARHQGGKARVPNPNSKTRERFPQVSIGTAMGYESGGRKPVFEKVMREYKEWMAKGKSKGKKPAPKAPAKEKGKKPAPPVKEKDKKPAPPAKEPATTFHVPTGWKLPDDFHKTVAALIKEHGEEFKKILNVPDAKKLAQKHREGLESGLEHAGNDNRRELARFALDQWDGISPTEHLLHMRGHEIGNLFRKVLQGLTNQKVSVTHSHYMEAWREGSNEARSQQMHGFLSGIGVKGSRTKSESNEPGLAGRVKDLRQKGKENKDLGDWFTHQYAFIQAFFQTAGIKEITLYRGIRGQGVTNEPPKDGDPLSLVTREASSFSGSAKSATYFGRPTVFKVPVERIFASSLTHPPIGSRYAGGESWDEDEYIVMGASDLNGKVRLEKDCCGSGND